MTAAALAAVAGTSTALAATRYVATAAGFQKAAQALRTSGGTIVLLPHVYTTQLTLGTRGSRRLDIVGTRGARVQSMLLEGTQHVRLRHLSVHPLKADGGILAQYSSHLTFRNDAFTAAGTNHIVELDLDHSDRVVVQASRFSHCGDNTPEWSLCLLPRFATHVTVESSWFHDCLGCDFIHGRAGADFVVRGNRFARALACPERWVKCGHSDMIELFEAHGMLVRDNVFGVNQRGGAQLYLALRSDNVDVVDNLFMRTDRRAPGITPRIGILVGTRHSLRAPHHVRIINDTVLSGRAWRARTAESIVLGPHYGRIPAADRPVIANTVLARMADPRIVCPRAGALVDDVLATGSGCRRGVVVGDPALTPKGEPTSGSTLLIDQASATYAPARDLLGHRRVGPPDIGCFEYLP